MIDLSFVPTLLAAAPGAAPDAASSVEISSVWDFVVKGGRMMIPIGLCSLVALAVLAERLLMLRRRNVVPPDFGAGLDEAIGDEPRDVQAGLDYCRRRDVSIARILSAGVRKLGRPVEQVERAITEAAEREMFRLRKYLRVLSVIAAVAPLMGLLGTIFGMILAFQTVAASAEALGKTELLAKGIYEAMITTAAGLIVAIPALIFYHWLSAKIERLAVDMDHVAADFIDRHAAAAAPAPAPAHPTTVHAPTRAPIHGGGAVAGVAARS